MKKYFFYKIGLISAVLLTVVTSCKKQDDFLNAKSNLNDVRPQTLTDFQEVLDDAYYINFIFPSIGEGGIDNYYIPDTKIKSLALVPKNIYVWQPDIFQGAVSPDWQNAYLIIERCNIVLDGLLALSVPTDANTLNEYNNVKGSALFYRAMAFYMLSEAFCKPYVANSASSDLGIVLRLTSDVNAKSSRSSVQQTYDQMISDLKLAVGLLPVTPAFQMRPSRPAANALLSKVYLEMGDYGNAATSATNSLNDFNTLLDFNSSLVNPASTFPFPQYPHNPEISFYAYANGGSSTTAYRPGSSYGLVDPALLNSYDSNDLRKTCFYNTAKGSFKGSYQGTFYPFCGIATNEVYLIRAESYARTGNINGALADLNTLLVKRYISGTYVPVTITDPTQLLTKILLERRKELPFTGQLRWEDLRRLNQDPTFAVTLTRVSQGITYTLPPNDPRYVLPIPDNEIQLSGIQQNPR